ncbi:hypothetical protein NQ314_008116 [Rhamnusium bicolor]|uniref:Uncharacterized protein n=1 Tax=Rhamnusium bicolor TaxID=1586634 RepID=A0AAV8YG38_9CUCU|nr:hypothetical protein NQ314_008116 [Rhamnusium bicolor]
MYNLYKIKFDEEGLPKNETGKSWVYHEIFKTEFNLGFNVPSNDTCDVCDNLRMILQECQSEDQRVVVQQQIDSNLKDAEIRYNIKKNDKVSFPEKTE